MAAPRQAGDDAEVVAVELAEHSGMLHLLERTGLGWNSTIDSGMATWGAPPEPAEDD